MIRKFDQKNMHKLDNPQRRIEIPPTEILKVFGLTNGNIVADVGCGIGYFSIPAASIVGNEGIVYALDVSQEMINEVQKRVVELSIPNIHAIRIKEYQLVLENLSVDFFMISLVLHEVEDKDRMMDEMNRVLKSGGTFSMIEWEKIKGISGPPMEERISFEEMAVTLAEKGYNDITKHTISENFYGVTARKS